MAQAVLAQAQQAPVARVASSPVGHSVPTTPPAMGAHESCILSLLQTETGPSPYSRSPSAPPFFGGFMGPMPPVSLGAAALGGRSDPRHPGVEVLLGAPPQIDVRPDLAAAMNTGAPAPTPVSAGASTAVGRERHHSPSGLPPQGGAFSRGGGAMSTVWV
uniref:Uncharacterized protein n=1 Tax=Alexandrium catenella TaxID=2925 RepID=A0A7S1RUJ3_ALECA